MDTLTVKTIVDVGKQLISKAFEQSPNSGNGYGFALGAMVLFAIYLGVTSYFDRRDAKKLRESIDAANERREEAGERREKAASKRAIDEQEARDKARERVLEEQRHHRDELRKSFVESLSPLELRVGTLERQQQEHDKQIALLNLINEKHDR